MTMTFELITPEWAKMMLEDHNGSNRNISRATVDLYAHEMSIGKWDSETGSAISIDDDGTLRDGQHRLAAIIKAKKSVMMWVCRGVSETGIYDNNRKRSMRDQISMIRPDIEAKYKSHLYIALAKLLIDQNKSRRRVSASEITDFTERHKDDLEVFFSAIPQTSVRYISVATVFCSMYMAFCSGVNIMMLSKFYEILSTGMSIEKEGFPVIAYRNYLLDRQGQEIILDNIKRCQYAIKSFLSGNGSKQSRLPQNLIYPFPYIDEEGTDV